MHDATFWQPLALEKNAAKGLAAVPADVQNFADSQWGRVRGFALSPSPKGLPIDPGAPPLGVPSTAAYRQAAVAVIRATAARSRPSILDASPVGWNAVAESLSSGASAAARLRSDVRLYFALNGALHDAAIAAWGAKRAYQSPRPISMIRYLAFNNQLPLVPGLVKNVGGKQLVLRAGQWVAGESWSPLAATPASPGWVSGDSAFAYAAGEVLTAFTGRSFAGQTARAATQGVDSGIELSDDVTAGRTLGTKVGKLVWGKLRD